MWFLVAIYMINTPMQEIKPVQQFDTRALCESYVEAVMPTYTKVFEGYHVTAYDNGVADNFGIACITQTQET